MTKIGMAKTIKISCNKDYHVPYNEGNKDLTFWRQPRSHSGGNLLRQ